MNDETLRILDANLNRAREALRVIEDHARFTLDDADIAGRVKHARHDLRAIVEIMGADRLLAARDIETDVGRTIKTERELRRESSADVLRASFARLCEATRVIGEYAKLENAEAAEIAERVRYLAYDLEQCVVLRGELRRRFASIELYVIITEALCRGDWLHTAAAALEGGARCLQLREKQLSDEELLRRAKRLRELTREHGALLIVNDRADIARLSGADGVHLGQDDLAIREARRIAGGNLLIGKSTHSQAQFVAALSEQPDYIAIGPIFQSVTKPQELIAGLETLRACAEVTGPPLVAIGGIDSGNARDVRAAAACGLCVCSAVIGADDPSAAASALLVGEEAALERPRTHT